MPFACVLCDGPAALVRVAYTVNGKLFSGVPMRVCTKEDCVKKRGGTVVDEKHLTPLPSETTMLRRVPSPAHETTQEEYQNLQLVYDDWVAHGKPGYFSDWVAKVEDVGSAD